jgi:hypothetical protein
LGFEAILSPKQEVNLDSNPSLRLEPQQINENKIQVLGLTFWIASNLVAALAVSHNDVPKLRAQFSILK